MTTTTSEPQPPNLMAAAAIDIDDGERAALLGSIEWAWQHWPAEDPRWRTVAGFMQMLNDETVRMVIPESDTAWAALSLEIVDAIEQVFAPEISNLDDLHHVAEVAASISERASIEIHQHLGAREAQLTKFFGELEIGRPNWPQAVRAGEEAS